MRESLSIGGREYDLNLRIELTIDLRKWILYEFRNRYSFKDLLTNVRKQSHVVVWLRNKKTFWHRKRGTVSVKMIGEAKFLFV